jgi:hypothetical protein
VLDVVEIFIEIICSDRIIGLRELLELRVQPGYREEDLFSN